ncbi:MAG: hypothetical protein ABJL55_21175 [Roseibium sp.]
MDRVFDWWTVFPNQSFRGFCMIARVVVFCGLVTVVAGATVGMGLLVEPATACQAYKTC